MNKELSRLKRQGKTLATICRKNYSVSPYTVKLNRKFLLKLLTYKLNTNTYIVMLYCLSHIDFNTYKICLYNDNITYFNYKSDTSLWFIDYNKRIPLSKDTLRRCINNLIKYNILYYDKFVKCLYINPHLVNCKKFIRSNILQLFDSDIGFNYELRKNNFYEIKRNKESVYLNFIPNSTLKFISTLSYNSISIWIYLVCNMKRYTNNIVYNNLSEINNIFTDIDLKHFYTYLHELNKLGIINIIKPYNEIYINPNLIFRCIYICSYVIKSFERYYICRNNFEDTEYISSVEYAITNKLYIDKNKIEYVITQM